MDVHSHLSTEEQKSDAETISASCASYISHSPCTPSLSESHQTLVSAVSVHQDTPTNWHSVDTVPLPLNSLYETSSFADVLSGARAAISALPETTPHESSCCQNNDSSFKSPSSQSESNSLMELQTVTPSRIMSSPTCIITFSDETAMINLAAQKCSERPQFLMAMKLQCLCLSERCKACGNFYLSDKKSQLAELTVVEEPSTTVSSLEYMRIGDPGSTTPLTNDVVPSSSAPNQPETSRQFQIIINPSNVAGGATRNVNETGSDDEDDQKSVKAIRQELNIEQDVLQEKTKISTKGKSTKLPRELRGLMGEANLRYARGERGDAIKMCREVIRLAPYAAEPFETLAMIYEERGDARKYLQYSLLAAHLTATDADQWVHLARLCLEQEDVPKALNCFNKALKVRPTDTNLAIESAELHKSLGNYYRAAYVYKTAVSYMPANEGEQAIKLVRETAKYLHSKAENTGAIELLQEAMKHHAAVFEDEDANMLCELMILSKRYGDVLQTLKQHSGAVLEFEDEAEESTNPDYSKLSGVVLPTSLAIDLKGKVAIASIRLNRSVAAANLIKDICLHDPDSIGDLQFDLAEALMETGEQHKALGILDLLIASPQFSTMAAVWLRHAECCRACAEVEKALRSYQRCIELAPGHVHTYVLYSELLRASGRCKTAIEALDEAEGYETDPKERLRLHLERYAVLKAWAQKKPKKTALACDVALMILANRLKNAFFDAKLMLVKRTKSSSNPLSGEVMLIKKTSARAFKYERTYTEVQSDGDCSLLWKDQWLDLVDEVMARLVQCRRFRDAVNLGEGAQCYSGWYDQLESRNRLECLTFSACIVGGCYQRSYTYIRLWLLRQPNTPQLWNMFNQITARTQDQRHHRFCPRLLVKVPDNTALGIMTAHNWLATGSYKSAVSEYIRAHRKMPDEPLLMMLIGICFVHIASQKYSKHRHSFIVQGLAFLQKYAEARKLTQESFYNIGRTLHQLGLEHFAVHYYQRALDCSLPVVSNLTDGYQVAQSHPLDRSTLDLRCEAAFNLSLIYKRSGNVRMANQLLRQYCIV